MRSTPYEYKTERFTEPPTAESLNRAAGDGWRLVSVTVDVAPTRHFYVAYLERLAATEQAVSAAMPESTAWTRESSRNVVDVDQLARHPGALLAAG